MTSRPRYGALFTVFTVVLVLGVIWAFSAVTPRTPVNAHGTPHEGGDTFSVKDPALIAASAEDYAKFAAEDAAWRARFARPISLREITAGGDWSPSPRQILRDSVYRLTQAGRFDDAIRALAAWLATHPDDTESMHELARLLVATSRVDDALPHYRVVLLRTGSDSVRAEYASALLAAKRYPDAAREYRTLVTRAPARDDYRLGLARALAWGEQWREAERELAALAVRLPGDTTVQQMLTSVRLAMEPTAAEGARWVVERPDYVPYRVAYARALMRERRFAEGLAQYDSVLSRERSLAMLREAAGAHAAARDSVGSARLLAEALALAPGDTALGAQYARALAWAGDTRGAVQQWSRLIAANPGSAEYHLERGRLYAWASNFRGAEQDLRRSAELSPSYAAHALLGDVYRWKGDFKRSKAAYDRALALRPGDPSVLASLAEIRRLESMVYAWAPVSPDRGWVSRSSYSEDNTGFLFLATGLARGFPVGRQLVFSLGGEQRYIAQRSWRDATRWVRGVAGTARVSYVRRSVMLSAHAGVAKHAMVDAIPTGGIGGTFWGRTLRASVDLSTGPVYTSLMTTHALVAFMPATGAARSTTPLIGRSATASVSVPIGRAELTAGGEQVWLSDGNRRGSVTIGARMPVTRYLNLVYAGNQIGYANRSETYWDPRRYQSHAAGIEVAVRRPTGFSAAARVMPGIARSAETFPLQLDSSITFRSRSARQLTAGGEIEYRQRQWAISAGVGYGRGREGGYESLNGSLRIQLGW